jgi:hypothetical protein
VEAVQTFGRKSTIPRTTTWALESRVRFAESNEGFAPRFAAKGRANGNDRLSGIYKAMGFSGV